MITLIAAIAKNNALGKNNDLIWHLPADLKRFRQLTTGHHMIMGRKTYESIGKPLPNRTTIIVSRNPEYFQEGCLMASSLEDAIQISKNEEVICIVGGEQIYRQALENDLVDALDITLVHHEFDADAFFPEIDTKIWEEISREDFKADEKNKFDYSFIKYQKRAN
ncbi:dihydrofolate reductase [Polaribacter gangjinensis]|uniref:Dihydrofolate reductase n=1 Tax=Polaribacter gangjinensis TaxID=574710 RepID=A0A2S7WCS9_9FLAO|nr:dihydrofolate reductase [Polaribacter gangjinensis]PQJ75062.1 diacylglycerol kinase [Polaribacter gangjinensis]